MSLFRSKEWWSVNLHESEQYDSQCMLVANIEKDRYQSILLGNHKGVFRVYGPTSGMTEEGEVVGYRPTDLLLEVQFPAPILQMAMGTLVSGCHDRNLAVLCPKTLSVYALTRKASGSAIGEQISLETVYQHPLRHSAYSFAVGPFGGGRGRDFLCVQALDGLLTFFEQESLAFQVRLPDFLLPSPFAYLERIDCFVFLNASLAFDCYSYESLASASQTESDVDRNLLKFWSFNIGESVLDVRAVGGGILVLTERNLYNLSDGGKLTFMKRLEYRPVACHAFVTAESKKLLLLIATDNRMLNIYEGTCLKWSTRVDQVPVCVNRIILSNLYGGIVLLSENGYLQCLYLGTRPSVYLMPPIRRAEIDVAEAEAELQRLHLEITERDVVDTSEVDLIAAKLTVEEKISEEEGRRFCRVSLDLTNQTPANRVQVTFAVPPPLSCWPETCVVSCCERTSVETLVSLQRPGAVAGLEVKAFVSYLGPGGTPFVVAASGRLPQGLVLVRAAPTKEAKFKVTVATNKAVCPLNVLFPEFCDNGNVLAVRPANSDAVVTVLTARTTQRYRLQSDCLSSIGLVLFAVVERLKSQFREAGDFSLAYDAPLPLQPFFQEVERYHSLLEKRRSARQKLSKQTCQYRTIQKKVLVNLKDVTPKPISNLNEILRDTYEMILGSVADCQALEEQLNLSRCAVGALCWLLRQLLELMTVTAADLSCLRVVFSGDVYDSDEQGWMEVQQAAAMFFLRTTLSKSTVDQQKPTEISLDPVANVSKVTKNFSAVVDRVTRGTHLLERSEYKKEVLPTIPGVEEEEDEEAAGCSPLPEGAKFASLQPEPIARKEKRLTKQERVDSLGTISEPEEAPGAAEASQAQQAPRGEAHPPGRGKEPSSFDSPEDSALWDVKLDEMRI